MDFIQLSYRQDHAHCIPRKNFLGDSKKFTSFTFPTAPLELGLCAALICDTAAGMLFSPPMRITSQYMDVGGFGN